MAFNQHSAVRIHKGIGLQRQVRFVDPLELLTVPTLVRVGLRCEQPVPSLDLGKIVAWVHPEHRPSGNEGQGSTSGRNSSKPRVR